MTCWVRSSVVLVASLLCLLAFATSASAECAWVLWAYSLEKGMGPEYSIEAARPTREECLTEVRDTAESMRRSGYTVTGGGPNASEVIGRKGTTQLKYFCLPDTVDPRGPKGKSH